MLHNNMLYTANYMNITKYCFLIEIKELYGCIILSNMNSDTTFLVCTKNLYKKLVQNTYQYLI